MEHYPVPVIAGVVKDYHERIIPDNKCSDVKNVIFEKGRIKSRWGYLSVGGNLPLNGEIMDIIFYEQLDDTKHILAFTTRDAYKYNTTTGDWDFITERYKTGTAACSAGTAVTGTGTSWDTSWPNNVMEIKFGTQDPNGTGTPDTWFTIADTTLTTAITLSTNGPNTGGAVNYVIRVCWSGDIDNEMSSAFPYDPGNTDKIVVVCNGIEVPKKWNGSGYFEDLGGNPNIAKFVNYFGSVGFEHLITSWIVDSGVDNPQRISTTNASTVEDWSSNTVEYDLYNSNDEIVGMKELGSRIFIYKTDSITEMWADNAGSNDDPFNFNQNKIQNVGTNSIRTVVNFGKFHIFFNEKNIWLFDGINVTPIGAEIINIIRNELNKEKVNRVFAHPMRSQNLYLLFIPLVSDDLDSVTDSTCDLSSGSATVSCDDTTNFKRGMLVSDIGSNIPASTKISSIDSSTQFTMSANATGTQTNATVTFTGDEGYPYKVYAYNYVEKIWSIWQPTHQMTAMGLYKKSFAPTWSGLSANWEDMSMRWSDLKRYDQHFRFLLGDKDGYIYEFEKTHTQDDLNNFTSQFVTADYEINDAKHIITFLELELGVAKVTDADDNAVTSTLQVEVSIDFGENWSDAVQISENWANLNGNYTEKILNYIERGKQVRFRITNVSGTPFDLEALMIGFNDQKGKKK